MRAGVRRFVLALLLLGGQRARAQQPQVAPDLGAEAELHFNLGVRAYAAGKHEAALEHLLLSNRLAANRKVVFNIARAYEALGDATAAWSHYADFAAAEPEADLRAPAEAAMERLASRVALLRVETVPAGAAIYVDRRDLGQRGVTPRTVAVGPGTHRVMVDAPGHLSKRTSVEAVVGQVGEATLVLEPTKVAVALRGGPDGALVRNDQGELLGRLPEVLQLAPGRQVLVVSAPGYRTLRLEREIRPGVAEDVVVQLEQALGTFVMAGRNTRAMAEVDGVSVGYLPTSVDLPAGLHTVQVQADGHHPSVFEIRVEDGETLTYTPRLIPRTDVFAASQVTESLLEAPSTVVVISREDIQRRGYTDLAEVIPDLPGFDAIVANGVTYMLAYQRGYRTPQTQRTLLLTDGLEDNLMWSQSAELSRQFPFTDIERIEVLYGPASAVYGPNAFLGVINVVTVDPRELDPNEHASTVQLSGGSWRTGIVDGSVRGRLGALAYAVSGRWFGSAEPNLDGRWGFVDQDQLSDPDIWGPVLRHPDRRGAYAFDGHPLGVYADPSEDWGVRARVFLGGLELGTSSWEVSEGYGPYYATDRAQVAPQWNTAARRYWARLEGDLGDAVSAQTVLERKRDRIWGSWAEASPDGEHASHVSLTQWNAPSSSWEARQQISWTASEDLLLSVGGRWVRSELTRQYDVPGYWAGSAYSSQAVEPGSGIGHSSDPFYIPPPAPQREMPAENLISTDDLGGFAQAIADVRPFRFNAGIRYDWNSAYGSRVSPRATAIWNFAENFGALKLMYGRAFQEPSARQLWSEWDGRGANPQLKPESVDHVELIAMFRTADVLVEGSWFGSHYTDVIKEEAENAGERDITGFELRATGSVANPLRTTEPIDVWGNYTFTATRSSQSWNPVQEKWAERPTPIGDIAPHKLNAGLTVPAAGWTAFHLRTNVVSRRLPYSRNPLRSQGETFPSYALFDAMVEAHGERWRLDFQVDNLLNSEILQPGAEAANAGDDFEHRSAGYHNSAIPMPGRGAMLTLTLDLGSRGDAPSVR